MNLLYAICDDKIVALVTVREIYVGERPFTGGECGNWLVVKFNRDVLNEAGR